MSTLAAARADNFYYPPNFDPKKGGLNKQQGQHPLRERAKKLDEGILVIRFEMPFNVWCQGCQHLIGKGVRFNAEKKQIGNYHSTKIWSFSMRSPCCQTRIEIQTDPKNCEYQVVAGARRKVEAYTAQDAEVMELEDRAEAAEAAADPFRKLERGDADKRKAVEAAKQLSMLVADSQVKHRDDYAINKELRRRNRGLRKDEAQRDEHRQHLNLPDSITLAPLHEQDRQAASLVVFGDPHRFEERWRARRQAICQAAIFPGPSASSAAPAAAQGAPSPHASRQSHSGRPHAAPAGQHEGPLHSRTGQDEARAPANSCPASGQRPAKTEHRSGQTGLGSKLLQRARSLGLRAAGVLKPSRSGPLSGSAAGSKHSLSQAGKLSRIRLGAKLVLGNVPT